MTWGGQWEPAGTDIGPMGEERGKASAGSMSGSGNRFLFASRDGFEEREKVTGGTLRTVRELVTSPEAANSSFSRGDLRAASESKIQGSERGV